MGHRQWAGRPRVAYQPRGLDPFETLQIARTNLIAEAARIGMMPPDLRDYNSSYDPSRRLCLRAGNGSSCPKLTFAPAGRRSAKQSSEQRPVNLERLEIAVAVA